MSKLLLSVALLSMGLAPPQTAVAQGGGPAAVTVLRNRDVLTMVEKQLPAEEIIARIRSSSCNFDTFPPVLDELKMKGVPDAVLRAMVEAPHGPPTDSRLTGHAAPKFIEVMVRAGTPVAFRTTAPITSKVAKPGHLITFRVTGPVVIDNVTVIAEGALATARVVKAGKNASWGRPGTLGLEMQDVAAVDGSHVPLRFALELKGAGREGVVVAGTVATGAAAAATVVGAAPVALIWGLKKGKNATIPLGTRYEAVVGGDTLVSGLEPRVILHDAQSLKQLKP